MNDLEYNYDFNKIKEQKRNLQKYSGIEFIEEFLLYKLEKLEFESLWEKHNPEKKFEII